MRKLLFVITTMFCSSTLFSQSVNEDVAKLGKLTDVLKVNTVDSSKLDSVRTEAQKIYQTTTSIQIKQFAKKIMSMASDIKNVNATAKPMKMPFENLEKDFKKKFSLDIDKFKNIGFIEVKNISYPFEPYLSVKENIVRLRLKSKYKGSDWVFFDRVIFLINGKNYEYKVDDTDTKVLSAYSVMEKSDISVDENVLDILRLIANTEEKIEYRFEGKKHSDDKLSKQNKESIKLILELYDKLTQ